jgi:hypothetical protein
MIFLLIYEEITYHMTAELLNTVKQGDKQVPLEILVRAKGSDDNGAIYKTVLDAIPGSKVTFVLHISRLFPVIVTNFDISELVS